MFVNEFGGVCSDILLRMELNEVKNSIRFCQSILYAYRVHPIQYKYMQHTKCFRTLVLEIWMVGFSSESERECVCV